MQKAKKILFVHEVSYEDKVIFEMHEFPELLSLRGHQVYFLDYREGRPQKTSRFVQKKLIQGRVFPNARINLWSMNCYFREPFGRILVALIATFKMGKILDDIQPDVVVLYSVPTSGWQLIKAAKKRNLPVVHRSIDVSHLLRVGPWKKIVKMTERFVFRNANQVIANNAELARYVASHRTHSVGVSVLPPGYLYSTVDIVPWNETTEFDFVFMGTLFRFCGLRWFIDQMSMSPYGMDRTLLIIGDGEDALRLKAMVKDLGLDSRVTFTGFVNFQDLSKQIARATVAILPFEEIPVANFALPGKAMQYIKFGRPVVATRLTGLSTVLPSGKGIIYAGSGPHFLKCAVDLLNSPKKCSEIVQSGQGLLQTELLWDEVLKEFEDLLNKAIVDRKSIVR